MYVWPETIWAFSNQEAKLSINEVWRQEVQSYETLGILAEFHKVSFTRFFCSSSSNFFLDVFSPLFFVIDNGVLFIGKALWIFER